MPQHVNPVDLDVSGQSLTQKRKAIGQEMYRAIKDGDNTIHYKVGGEVRSLKFDPGKYVDSIDLYNKFILPNIFTPAVVSPTPNPVAVEVSGGNTVRKFHEAQGLGKQGGERIVARGPVRGGIDKASSTPDKNLTFSTKPKQRVQSVSSSGKKSFMDALKAAFTLGGGKYQEALESAEKNKASQ